jgi:CheY-like chemotaxis protein
MDASAPVAQSPARVLLVDDEPNILNALKRLLRVDGYHIHAVTSPHDGLALLEQEPFDLVMSDQRMPDMTGVEFLRQVKMRWPEAMRIVLSGYTELESVTAAINEGAVYKFLTKPWEDEQLRSQVAGAIRYKRLEDENRRFRRDLEVANAKLAQANVHLEALVQEQRRWLQADDASLKLAHEILHRLPLAVLGSDIDGVVVFSNAAAEALLGRPDAPVLGSEVSQWLNTPSLAQWQSDDGACATPRAGLPAMQVECALLTVGTKPTGCLYVLKPLSVSHQE